MEQAVWFLKCRSLTLKSWIDDTDIVEEDGIGDAALDDNVIAAVPRPGTSLSGSSSIPRRGGQSVRPIDASGRPISGYMRPNTASKRGDLQSMLKGGNRVGTWIITRVTDSFILQEHQLEHRYGISSRNVVGTSSSTGNCFLDE